MKGIFIEGSFFLSRQIVSCIFPLSFFFLLYLSHHVSVFDLHRYDFIFLGAVALQIALVLFRIETPRDLGLVCIFHVIGLALELYKTSPGIGSWSYPEEGFFKIGVVPLYSGFMYASVASYIIQSWKALKFTLNGFPKAVFTIPFAVAIYLNFFTRHYIPDMRWLIIPMVLVIFWKTKISFFSYKNERAVPLTVYFLIIGFLIYLAENISTYFGAWKYPYQLDHWTFVAPHKVTSWFLLVIISFLIIASVKMREGKQKIDFASAPPTRIL